MKGSRLIVALVTACLVAIDVAAQPVAPPFEPAHSTDRRTQRLPRGFKVELALSAGPDHLRADATVDAEGGGTIVR